MVGKENGKNGNYGNTHVRSTCHIKSSIVWLMIHGWRWVVLGTTNVTERIRSTDQAQRIPDDEGICSQKEEE